MNREQVESDERLAVLQEMQRGVDPEVLDDIGHDVPSRYLDRGVVRLELNPKPQSESSAQPAARRTRRDLTQYAPGDSNQLLAQRDRHNIPDHIRYSRS